MRMRNYFYGLLACAALGACSNDEVVENSEVSQGAEAYVRVQIALPEGSVTRGTEGSYVESTTEHAIKSIFFAFYDASGDFVADGSELGITSDTDKTGNVEAISDAVIALTLQEGQSYPAQVVAYVNIDNAKSLFGSAAQGGGKSIADAQALIAEQNDNVINKSGNTDYFMMTSSTYLKNGAVKIGADLTPQNFFESEELAKNSNPVEIYVERLAAKVIAKYGITDKTVNLPSMNSNGYALQFVPTGYALNGKNTRSYYLKNIETSWNSWTWNWNKDTDFRCFWAKDPNYDEPISGNTPLDYVAIGDDNWPTTELTTTDEHVEYCKENTFNATAFNAGAYANATHLLILGHYTVTKEGSAVTGNFYKYAGAIYEEADLKKQLAPANLLFTRSESEGNITYTEADPSIYTIKGVDVTNVKLEFTLPTGENATTYYYLDPNADTSQDPNAKYVEVTEANVKEKVQNELDKYTAEGFQGGKAYFAVPIEHFGPANADGEYGVVRNHIYELTINSIKNGLGTGVFDPNEEIIPKDEPKKYYVGARINILSWKKVSQSVDL